MPVAELGESSRHGREREVGRIALVDLVPAERRGYSGGGRRRDRVGGRPGAILRVLIVIHEPPVALFFPPLAGGNGGRPSLHLASQRQRCPADLVKTPARHDAHIDVYTPGP